MINNLILNENLFLIILGFIWIIGAILQDLRRREVDNIWNFSLIAFALAYRLSISIFNGNYLFFINGLIGLGIFLILGNLFYYSRMFAGGDAKLMIALGTILPLSFNWIVNLKIFGVYILLVFLTGSIYVFLWALVLVFNNWVNFKRHFLKQWVNYKTMLLVFFLFSIIWIVFMFFINSMFVLTGIAILLFPILFVFAKAVEESCMIKKMKPAQITEGDWLYKDVFFGKRMIRANWEGVSKKELELIRKNKKEVLIKIGVPFTPSFLFGLISLLIVLNKYWAWF